MGACFPGNQCIRCYPAIGCMKEFSDSGDVQDRAAVVRGRSGNPEAVHSYVDRSSDVHSDFWQGETNFAQLRDTNYSAQPDPGLSGILSLQTPFPEAESFGGVCQGRRILLFGQQILIE